MQKIETVLLFYQSLIIRQDRHRIQNQHAFTCQLLDKGIHFSSTLFYIF